MDEYTACEQAYKNGYEQGKMDSGFKWISVDERLPEYKPTESIKAYLVAYDTREGKQMSIALYSDYMYASEVALPPNVTWRDFDSHVIRNVTHWMNIPEPPHCGAKMEGEE